MKYILILFLVVFSFGFDLKYKSFQSDFNQSVQSDNKTIYYSGKVYIQNSLVFWNYQKPIIKKIWATYNKIYVYEPDLEQVTIYNTSKNDNFFELIKTATKIKKNLYLKEYNNKKIYFVLEDGMIKKIYYKDKIDNLVTLNFYNIKPKKFDLTTFNPKYPQWVDIIYSK